MLLQKMLHRILHLTPGHQTPTATPIVFRITIAIVVLVVLVVLEVQQVVVLQVVLKLQHSSYLGCLLRRSVQPLQIYKVLPTCTV